MGKYDVFRNQDGGFLLDVQTDLLHQLGTRVVVPLLPLKTAPKPITGLNPIFNIDGKDHLMATQFLSAVRVTFLKAPIANVGQRHAEITSAVDLLFSGI